MACKQAQKEAMVSEIEELEADFEEQVNTPMETKGCAIMDSGATVVCSSTAAAEEIRMQRLRPQ